MTIRPDFFFEVSHSFPEQAGNMKKKTNGRGRANASKSLGRRQAESPMQDFYCWEQSYPYKLFWCVSLDCFKAQSSPGEDSPVTGKGKLSLKMIRPSRAKSDWVWKWFANGWQSPIEFGGRFANGWQSPIEFQGRKIRMYRSPTYCPVKQLTCNMAKSFFEVLWLDVSTTFFFVPQKNSARHDDRLFIRGEGERSEA